MRIPTTAIVSKLRWTDSGTVWADWILTGPIYRFTNHEHKKAVRDAHTALYRSLPGEALLMGLIATIEPSTVVERMLKGIDTEQCPAWAEDVLATYDSLTQIPLGKRIFWLSVPLGSSGMIDRLRGTSAASMGRLRDQLGIQRRLPPADVIAEKQAQADDIASRLGFFSPQPATAAQMLWLHQHMLDRGLFLDEQLPSPGDLASQLATSSPRATLGEPLIDEGGKGDYTNRRLFNPMAPRNRLVKITDINRPAAEPSYQALGVITKPPKGGMTFPGSEMLAFIDESGLDIDWAQRIHTIAPTLAATANQRALDKLNDQDFHLGGAGTNITRNADLAMRGDSLKEYIAALSSDELEVETRITTIVAIGAPDRESLHQQVTVLDTWVTGWSHALLMPLGRMEELWWAMHPGTPTGQIVREFEQITTSKNAAGLVPIVSTTVGDSRGMSWALNLANGPLLDMNLPCGPTDTIHLDLNASERDTSSSIAFVAEPGAGKSVAMKKALDACLDMGGTAVVVDRTDMGEYALWAEARGDVSVVEIINPKFSFDPLRLFPGSEGTQVMQSFLTLLLGIRPKDDLGITISDVLDPNFRKAHSLGSMGSVLSFLEASSASMHQALLKKIRVFSRLELGRVVFDDSLPTPDITQAMVIRTNRLKLPTPEQLEHQHLFEQMPLEQIYGRAYYALIAGYARSVCFRDRTRMALFAMDEVTSQITSSEVEGYVREFNDDGRKHRAAVIVGGQRAGKGLGSKEFAQSFPTRIVMRMRNPDQARDALRWMLGEEPDEELVRIITTDTSPLIARAGEDYVEEHRRGEMLMVDAMGRIGRGKILAASQSRRFEAAMATGFQGAK